MIDTSTPQHVLDWTERMLSSKPLPVPTVPTTPTPAITAIPTWGWDSEEDITLQQTQHMPITQAHARLVDTSHRHETRALPIAERILVEIIPTGELIAGAVRQFIAEQGYAPDVALLNPMRLLTIPSSLWGRYQLLIDGGQLVTLALHRDDASDVDSVVCVEWPR